MPAIHLVDTSVLLNVLDVPGFNQDRTEVLSQLSSLIKEASSNLLLPFAAIIETGNHIAHLSDGGHRRRYAKIFVDSVLDALAGQAPWTPTQLVDLTDWAKWLHEFPDSAMAELGLGDLSILKEWNAACARHPQYRVRVWSLDDHLAGYDRPAEA